MTNEERFEMNLRSLAAFEANVEKFRTGRVQPRPGELNASLRRVAALKASVRALERHFARTSRT